MNLSRRVAGALCVAAFAAAVGLSAMAQAPAGETLLWPGGAPGAERMKLRQELHTSAAGQPYVTGVMRPTLTVYRPSGPFTTAVLVVPGGGFRNVVVGREGHDVARWLARHGVAAGVLTYRLPSEGWAQRQNVVLEDSQRAIRLLRQQTGAARVGVMGFSAGGAIAIMLDGKAGEKAYAPIDAADALSAKPDFLALGYAPFDSRDLAKSPAPAFLFHAADDPKVDVKDSRAAEKAIIRRGGKAEMHVFRTGGHGFGLGWEGQESAAWPGLFLEWLKRL